jgi:hypothetical protein
MRRPKPDLQEKPGSECPIGDVGDRAPHRRQELFTANGDPTVPLI